MVDGTMVHKWEVPDFIKLGYTNGFRKETLFGTDSYCAVFKRKNCGISSPGRSQINVCN